MVSILIAIPILTIAAFIFVTVRFSPKDPIRFARMIAKQQRLVLNTIKKADPGMTREKVYLKTMGTRTPHHEDELRKMLNQAKKEAGEAGEKLRFNELVGRLAILEYTKRVPEGSRKTDMFPAMKDAVKDLIPEDL